ncbi:MAG: PGF-pre-PGF domain-containing protein [Candidatus Aenigmarchaeota archaeon]|nr:PGF-pre-PGF domain-containing protein [Candidatus Aenigmarchaeota archaeon]
MNKKGIMKLGLFFVIFLVIITILVLYVTPTTASVNPGNITGYNYCGGSPCTSWVNVTKGDMFFADNNQVFILVNYSCVSPSVCNATMNVTGNFSEIGGNSSRAGVFKQNATDGSWAIFELNDTVNLTLAGGSIMMEPRNVTINATDGNISTGFYLDNVFAPVMLVNMSTLPGCPPPTEPLPPQIPLLNGTLVNVGACWDGNCTVEDRAQYMNATHYALCGPTFGGDTTNFTAVADTGNFSNFSLVIEVPGIAKINYTQNVSMDDPQKSQALFEFAVKNIMAGPRIGINETEWNGTDPNKPNLNLSARLTMYNVSNRFGISGRPQIFKYAHTNTTGIPCPPFICSDFVWDGENITFNVTSFSDYGMSDAINITLESPSNLTYSNNQTINFTFTPVWNTSVTNMDNCTLYGNFTGSWLANETNDTRPLVNGSINWINNTVSSDGPYSWNIYCYDNTSQYDFYSINWTIFVDTAKPTFTNNNSNTSSINATQPVLIYANWSDDNNLDYAWLSTNETGTWVNYTDGNYSSPYDINLTAGETWSNFTWDNDTFELGVVAWKIYANDSAGNENVTGNMTFSVSDTISPTYSNNSTNTTLAGIATEFRLRWQDYGGLSGYIFSFDNCTGGSNLVNDSWVSIIGLTNWSNVTKTPNYTTGCNVAWKVYANDTSDNWNSTGIMNYTTKNASGLYCTQNAQCIGGYCVHSVCRASSTFCGDGYCDTGEACAVDSTNCLSGYSCTNGCVATNGGGGTSGTGGSTGGTVSTAVIRLAVGKVNITMTSLTTGGKLIANIARFRDVAMRGMNITVVNNVGYIKIMISKLQTLPSTVPFDINGKVYHYINIERINITDSDINTVNIEFAVNKTWLTDNNVDATNITLYRWANNRWNDLSATKIAESTTEVFYKANSPGLSVFIIGTTGGAPPEPEPEPEEGCEESWSCTDWSECTDKIQTRTCTDSNNCGTTVNKPAESQSCEVTIAGVGPTTVSILTNVIIIVAAIVICVFIFLQRVRITSFLHDLAKKTKGTKKKSTKILTETEEPAKSIVEKQESE